MNRTNEEALEPELASEAQIAEWLGRFSHYRQPPTRATLLRWLGSFDHAHLDIAHKILDQVVVVSELEIQQGYKRGLEGLPGWSRSAQRRNGRWYFAGVGGAGESGPAMLRLFREANGLTAHRWNNFFVSQVELPRLRLSARDSVVFVDDFAGTGCQMVGYWPILEELIAAEAKCYLLLTALTTRAADSIGNETEFIVRADRTLELEANVYSAECGVFTTQEMRILDRYGRVAWQQHPRGFGACGLCFVLSHKTPNNTIPVLHANHDDWKGLFPRHLIAAG